MLGMFSNKNSRPASRSFQVVQAPDNDERADQTPVSDPGPDPTEASGEGLLHQPRRMVEIKVELHRQILDKMNLSIIDQMTPEEFKTRGGQLIRELLDEVEIPLNQNEKQQLVSELLDEIVGLGPLEPLLKDPTITDILVNTYDNVFIEREGKLYHTPVQFKDETHLRRIIDKIVSGVGRRLDESQPMVDARLPDGSRVNAVIPPVAVDGALLSIRKFSKIPIDLERLVELGAFPTAVAELLQGIVRSRRNVLISGGTGSGKTTMLNAMSAYIGESERIVTIEDAAELQLQQIHVARMETRPPNIEDRGEVTQRDLVRNALRMRPDRIIVGEVRGGEAFDMLQAMNTGHEGSMTTIHANTCRDALSRLEQMIGMARLELNPLAMRQQVAAAIDVIIQVQRMSDGGRRLISLSEITGMEGQVITLQEIIRFERESTDEDGKIHGYHIGTGIRPNFIQEFQTRNIAFDDSVFDTHKRLE